MSSSFTRPHPVHTWPSRSHMTTTYFLSVHMWPSRSHDHIPVTHDPFKHYLPVPKPHPGSHVIIFFTMTNSIHDRLVQINTFRSHFVTTPFTRGHPMDISPVYTWPGVMVLRRCLDQYLSSCHIWTKSIKGFENNAVNLQHENCKSVTLAFRSGVREGNFRPISSNIPY